MTAIGARLERQYPDSNTGKSVAVSRMRDDMVGNVRLTLYLLLGAVALVLLIACANVANLLLAKATARTREIAIRSAVGASRGRIVRQLVTESLVLAMVAGAAGLLFAKWGSDALVALAPGNVPRLAESGIDGWVLAFTLGISVGASLLFGLAPALQVSRVDLSEALKQGATRAVAGGLGPYAWGAGGCRSGALGGTALWRRSAYSQLCRARRRGAGLSSRTRPGDGIERALRRPRRCPPRYPLL